MEINQHISLLPKPQSTDSERPFRQISSDEFLDKALPVDQMPELFSFQSEEVQYGLAAISKWSKETGGRETSGILYRESSGNIRFKDLSVGTNNKVNIFVTDLTRSSPTEIQRALGRHPTYLGDSKAFYLLPEDYSTPEGIDQRNIIGKGKRVLGSVHVHPSGNPPNGVDLAILLFESEDTIKGVIAGNTHFLMVASCDTPHRTIEPTADNRSTTMHEYGNEIYKETAQLVKTGMSQFQALRISLIKYCEANQVALYEGDIQTNIYEKVTTNL